MRVIKHYEYQHGPNAGTKTASVNVDLTDRWFVKIFRAEPEVVAVEFGFGNRLDFIIDRNQVQPDLLTREVL